MNRREFARNAVGVSALAIGGKTAQSSTSLSGINKEKDLILYSHENFYCAFPSVVRRPDGELLVAFRRAPNRKLYGEKGHTHTDANSYLMMIRSRDNGKSWSKEPELIFAHPFGGSQDPCMVQLRDHSIVCTSYAWAPVDSKVSADHSRSLRAKGFVFLGGYLVKSWDGGHSWQGPIVPPSVPTERGLNVFGQPTPALNRGAMVQGRDGRLYWAVQSFAQGGEGHSSVQLLISSDGGETWEYPRVSFNETSLYETPGGDLVAFMRTANFDGHTAITRSSDGGKSFELWQDAGFRGHPHHAVCLPDNRVFLIHGYRHPPYGIRARVLNPECRDFASAEEIVLRDDGGSYDLGYPWATLMSDGRLLAVYYFNRERGLRQIEGTILSLG